MGEQARCPIRADSGYLLEQSQAKSLEVCGPGPRCGTDRRWRAVRIELQSGGSHQPGGLLRTGRSEDGDSEIHGEVD